MSAGGRGDPLAGDETVVSSRHAEEPPQGAAPRQGGEPLAPWEAEQAVLRRTPQRMPRVYPPRHPERGAVRLSSDEILRRVGTPPETASTPVRSGRERLPSLERRSRRARRATLWLYAVVVVGCGIGLAALAKLAIGW